MIRKFTPLPGGLGKHTFIAQSGTELQEFVRTFQLPATHELRASFDGNMAFTVEPIIRPEFAKQADEIEAGTRPAAPEPAKAMTDLEKRTVPELRRICVELELDPKEDLKKAELVAMIVKHNADLAAKQTAGVAAAK